MRSPGSPPDFNSGRDILLTRLGLPSPAATALIEIEASARLCSYAERGGLSTSPVPRSCEIDPPTMDESAERFPQR